MLSISPNSYGDGTTTRFSPITAAKNSPDNPIQKSLRENDRISPVADSVLISHKTQIKPKTAMYHSLLFPGWGQINNGKKKKAALFLIAEMVCIGGYIYKNYEIRHNDYSEWEKDILRTDKNTFLLYWLLSKFFGMVDAYVDAQ
ncbi:MAG TPA: hypothetical protein ENH82_20555, partial [bacterium]|nr:hypothetical protein [bacterium]